MLLNLGCGDLPIKNCLNVDIKPGKYVDLICDLSKFPWQWEDNSIDGIYMIHSFEHFDNPRRIAEECHRILKKGGFLYLQVPHSSSVSGIGTFGHYRTFSYDTFSHYLNDLFDTEFSELRWFSYPSKYNPYVEFEANQRGLAFYFLHYPIQFLINLNPRFFERFWCYWVGGAGEVVWSGRKI